MRRMKKWIALVLSAFVLLLGGGCHRNIPEEEISSAPNSSSHLSSEQQRVSSQEEQKQSFSENSSSETEDLSEESKPDGDAVASLPDPQTSSNGTMPSSEQGQIPSSQGERGSSVSATVTYQRGSYGYYAPLTDYEPAYSQLTAKQQSAYRAIAEAVSSMRTSRFYFNPNNLNQQGVTLTRSEVLLVYSAVMTDHPEYFWMSKTYVTNKQDCVYMELQFNCSLAQKFEKQTQLRQKVAEFKAELTDGMSEFALEKAVHDFVVSSSTYGYGNASPGNVDADAYNIYGALVGRASVCEGYARAVQYLCMQVGLECILQRGTAADNMGTGWVDHMWNAVKIDGAWYQLDATWDDPVYGNGVQRIGYDYFNLTKQQILEQQRNFYSEAGNGNQSELSNFMLPVCNATAASYQSMSGMILNAGDDVAVRVNEAIRTAQSQGKDTVEVFLDYYGGQNYSNSVDHCVTTDWIEGTGITHLNCTGNNGYLRISW